jgi:hypothetical protein
VEKPQEQGEAMMNRQVDRPWSASWRLATAVRLFTRTRATGRATVGAMMGTLLAIWSAACSGFILDLAPDVLLVVHLVAGIGGLLPGFVFLGRHWWGRRERIGRHPNTRTGYALLICLAVVSLSGLALLPYTSYAPLRWLHNASAGLLLLGLAAHTIRWSWRKQRTGRGAVPRVRPALYWQAAALVFAGGLAAWAWLPASTPDAAQARSATVALEHASLESRVPTSAAECNGCHGEITGQWRRSAHAGAASNPYYLAVTDLLIQEQGVAAARFCATCHNPIGLIQGEIDALAANEAALRSDGAGQARAYQARALSVPLAISARADEGVSCVLCHQGVPAATRPGNGSLRFVPESDPFPSAPYQQLLLRVDPLSHRRAMAPAGLQQAALCGACHNVYAPNGMALEPTFDEWRASPYPDRGVTCQHCHMPAAPINPVNSDLARRSASHGDLHAGWEEEGSLLQQAATLELQWQWKPAGAADAPTLLATVIITNSGAGHALPTGASDLRQLWLEVTLWNPAGQIVWQTGGLDAYGALGADAVQFRKILGDAGARPIQLHRIWMATQVLADTSLAPLERRAIPYAIPLVGSDRGPLRLSARLLYRTRSPEFAAFALQQPIANLTVHQLVAAVVTVPDPQ